MKTRRRVQAISAQTGSGLVAFQKSAGLAKAHWKPTTKPAWRSSRLNRGRLRVHPGALQRGLRQSDFSAIPACKTALNVTRSINRFLNEYCLPDPVEVHYREFDW